MNVPPLAATIRPWASLPLGRSLDGVVRAGFSAVALPVHGIAYALTGDVTPDDALGIGGLIAERDLDLVMLSHEAAFERSDAEALAALRRQIDHCVRLDVPMLVDVGCQTPAWYGRYLALMRAGASYAADRGVMIAMKPHGGISRTIGDTKRTVEQVDHPAFRICLDTGMLVHHAGDGALRDLDEIAAYVVAVGVRDHPGRGSRETTRRDPDHDAPGLPPAVTPGDGIIDFSAIYGVLDRHGFTGPSALETVRPAASVAETDRLAAQARTYLEAAIQNPRAPGPVSPALLKRPSPSARADALDCSNLSSARREHPLGSARYFDTYLIVEIGLPWPRAMGRPLAEYPRAATSIREPLQRATALARQGGRSVKPLALDPDPLYSRAGFTRIMRFDRLPIPANTYDRWEYLVPDEHAAGLLDALYAADLSGLDVYQRWRCEEETRDMLVCTHGSVDACCGTHGYPLYDRLRALLGNDRRTRAWRVSSFGGHRFAPTLIDLPTGRYWGNVTPDHLDALVRRTGSTEDLAEIHRGSGAWSHPIAQVAEAALFAHHGWDWIDRGLELESLDDGLDEKHARLLATVSSSDHDSDTHFAIGIDLIDDVDVTIGCTGLHGQIPIYRATTLTPVGPGAIGSARPLNLQTSAHGLRAPEAPH